ncbi:MAG: GTP 3',8-cyclase MoaA [Oscillospiraceae bacterium]|nr:GTP 3',8-cyclase MoaA [Oscillospiraceae bacterium]
MLDSLGRNINYMRVSVTDKCNLRCVYCMPENGVEHVEHRDLLSYEEIIRLGSVFAGLGVSRMRLTGGEPLVRKNLEILVRGLKQDAGIKNVYITTNGLLLPEQLPGLVEAGLDGVNISIDAADAALFKKITRRDGFEKVIYAIGAAMSYPGLEVKLNCVPTAQNERQLVTMASRFVRNTNLTLRFIELMPVGLGKENVGKSEAEVRRLLEDAFGPMTPLDSYDSGGPCRYCSLPGFTGRIGFISPMTHKFCAECNRIRLTANGFLKTCLQYNKGVDLKPFLSKSDAEIEEMIANAVADKPDGHNFTNAEDLLSDKRIMSQIGG